MNVPSSEGIDVFMVGFGSTTTEMRENSRSAINIQ